jgi:hypothetical protein
MFLAPPGAVYLGGIGAPGVDEMLETSTGILD